MTADQETPRFTDLKTKPAAIRSSALRRAAGNLLGTPISLVEYQTTPLHGGTLGDVQLIAGEAQTTDGRILPYRLVLKTQKKWERPGDPNSWRREYALYQAGLEPLFSETFRWPACYGTDETEDEIHIWMEYVNGTSGAALTLDDLAVAARELGRFQGRCHKQADKLQTAACLSDAEYLRRDFAQWTPDTVEYRYLRSDGCALPPRLRQMLIDTQEQADAIFQALFRLPRVLCHRDYWTENIFLSGGRVIAIDWDCAGWGVPGEDLASLIADETPVGRIGEYYQTLLPAYYNELGESLPLPPMHSLPIRKIILLKFGYRLLQEVLFSDAPEPKANAIRALWEIDDLPRLDLLV